MAKDSRFKYAYGKNASKLHKTVGELLRTDPMFAHYWSFQEYPVNRVNTSFYSGSHRFDWVIPVLKLVIECHGKQHFKLVTFDGNVDNAINIFEDTKFRDKEKKDAALAAGYRYITVSYKEEKDVTAALIFDKIKEAEIDLHIYELEHFEDGKSTPIAAEIIKKKHSKYQKEQRKKYLESEAHQDRLKQQRKYMQERYKKLREFKDGF